MSLRNDMMLQELVLCPIRTVEFEDVSGLFKNIIVSEEFGGVYSDNERIKLTKQFLSSEWKQVQKHKTFKEAYNDAVAKNYRYTLCLDPYGQRFDVAYMGVANVRNIASIPLVRVVEDKCWEEFDVFPDPYGSVPPSTHPEAEYFVMAVNIMKHALEDSNDSYFLIQENTNRKIYLDNDGLKDATTNQIIELDKSLYVGGMWVKGEKVKLDIYEATSTINWETQNLVYKEGTVSEGIFTKDKYKTDVIYNVINPDELTVQEFLFGKIWSIKNK